MEKLRIEQNNNKELNQYIGKLISKIMDSNPEILEAPTNSTKKVSSNNISNTKTTKTGLKSLFLRQ
jgi:hypothetical protein